MINADTDGILLLEIPKDLIYSLGDTECTITNDFLVIADGEEISAEITEKQNTNAVALEFAKGIHTFEIIGTFIVPDPSPAQYCGIVEKYDKQFLAPLDQTDHGVIPQFIRCNEGLMLVQKIDETPACVKPESIPKLAERGWLLKIDSMPVLCIEHGGGWLEEYHECENIEENLCSKIGGSHSVCESAYRHVTQPVACTDNYVEVCKIK